MSLTLWLDTTQSTLMWALANETGLIVKTQEAPDDKGYRTATLLPRLQDALTQHGFQSTDLTALGVNLGPGSFTGIRTGATIARLLGQFAPVTLYGFNAFELWAGSEAYRGQSVGFYLNAYRQQHYFAALTVQDDGTLSWLAEPQVRANTDFIVVETEQCVVEDSLIAQLGECLGPYRPLSERLIFTPSVMQLLATQQAEKYQTTWEKLLPIYLQLPHITISEKNQPRV